MYSVYVWCLYEYSVASSSLLREAATHSENSSAMCEVVFKTTPGSLFDIILKRQWAHPAAEKVQWIHLIW